VTPKDKRLVVFVDGRVRQDQSNATAQDFTIKLDPALETLDRWQQQEGQDAVLKWMGQIPKEGHGRVGIPSQGIGQAAHEPD
jgi:predicted secreted hydrolase